MRTGLRLTGSLQLDGRAEVAATNNFTRRLDNTQAVIEGRQQTLPDITLRWADSLGWLKNAALFRWLRVMNNVAIQAGMQNTRSETFAPAETPDGEGDRRVQFSRRRNLNATIYWRDAGGLLTNFQVRPGSHTVTDPGSTTETTTSEMSFDISRGFRLPASWNLRQRLRTRAGWSKTTSTSFITVESSETPSRLADNGRMQFSLNADTDVATHMKFSLLGSHVITYDNNYDRRFSQFTLTAAFTLQLNIGNMQ